jgi:hypothetical protein
MLEPIDAYHARVRSAAAGSVRAGATLILLAAIVNAYIGLISTAALTGTPPGATTLAAWIGLAGVAITSVISGGATVFALYTALAGPRRQGPLA